MTDYQPPHITSPERSKAMIASVIVHLLLLLIILTPYFKPSIKEEPIAGIFVSFGDLTTTDEEAGGDAAETSIEQQDGADDLAENDTPADVKPSPAEKISDATATPSQEDIPEVSSDPAAPSPTKDQSNDDSAAAAQQAAREKAAAEAEAQRKRAEALAIKKAQFGDLLAGGTGTSSSQNGILEGDPDNKALAELTAGSGNLGGGLVNRGLVYEPIIQETSQQTGRVVIDICVDSEGHVTEARYTQRGSTTTATALVTAAQKAALNYKFTPSEVDRQCGSVKIDFKLQ